MGTSSSIRVVSVCEGLIMLAIMIAGAVVYDGAPKQELLTWYMANLCPVPQTVFVSGTEKVYRGLSPLSVDSPCPVNLTLTEQVTPQTITFASDEFGAGAIYSPIVYYSVEKSISFSASFTDANGNILGNVIKTLGGTSTRRLEYFEVVNDALPQDEAARLPSDSASDDVEVRVQPGRRRLMKGSGGGGGGTAGGSRGLGSPGGTRSVLGSGARYPNGYSRTTYGYSGTRSATIGTVIWIRSSGRTTRATSTSCRSGCEYSLLQDLSRDEFVGSPTLSDSGFTFDPANVAFPITATINSIEVTQDAGTLDDPEIFITFATRGLPNELSTGIILVVLGAFLLFCSCFNAGMNK